jgi:hypothetical protein
MREAPFLERTFDLRRILRLWRRWVFLFLWLLAAILSVSLQYFGNFNSNHYAFPILVGLSAWPKFYGPFLAGIFTCW